MTPSGFEFFETKLNKKLAILDKHLSNNKFIVGTDFTIADAYAYAFTILNWIPAFSLDFDLSSYKNLRKKNRGQEIENRGQVTCLIKIE